jgi:hypothetical protein
MTCAIKSIRLLIMAALPCMLAGCAASQAEKAPLQGADRPALVLDGDTFITFYDLPSRRFRAMRRAFGEGDEALYQRDLTVSIEYLTAEMQRMDPRLVAPMQEVIDGLAALKVGSGSTVRELDGLFSRAHWLLAQHFLLIAQTRLSDNNTAVLSVYLTATAHHLERAALWSGAQDTPGLAQTLDELRASAAGLRKKPDRNRYQQLITRTVSVLKDLSKVINRPVRVNLN